MNRRTPYYLLGAGVAAWLFMFYPFASLPKLPDHGQLQTFPPPVLKLAAVRYAPVPHPLQTGLREEALKLRLASLTPAEHEVQRVIFDRPSTTLAGYLLPSPQSRRDDQRPLDVAARVFWLAAKIETNFAPDEILALILSTSRTPAALQELRDPSTPLARVAALIVDPVEDAHTFNRADAVLVLAKRTGRFDENTIDEAIKQIAHASASSEPPTMHLRKAQGSSLREDP